METSADSAVCLLSLLQASSQEMLVLKLWQNWYWLQWQKPGPILSQPTSSFFWNLLYDILFHQAKHLVVSENLSSLISMLEYLMNGISFRNHFKNKDLLRVGTCLHSCFTGRKLSETYQTGELTPESNLVGIGRFGTPLFHVTIQLFIFSFKLP